MHRGRLFGRPHKKHMMLRHRKLGKHMMMGHHKLHPLGHPMIHPMGPHMVHPTAHHMHKMGHHEMHKMGHHEMHKMGHHKMHKMGHHKMHKMHPMSHHMRHHKKHPRSSSSSSSSSSESEDETMAEDPCGNNDSVQTAGKDGISCQWKEKHKKLHKKSQKKRMRKHCEMRPLREHRAGTVERATEDDSHQRSYEGESEKDKGCSINSGELLNHQHHKKNSLNLFMQSIAEQIKNLSPQMIAQAKLKILETVNELQCSETEGNESTAAGGVVEDEGQQQLSQPTQK